MKNTVSGESDLQCIDVIKDLIFLKIEMFYSACAHCRTADRVIAGISFQTEAFDDDDTESAVTQIICSRSSCRSTTYNCHVDVHSGVDGYWVFLIVGFRLGLS